MTRDRTYRIVIALFSGLFRLLGLRFVVRGAEHLPASGAVVLASNHLSYLDFTFVGYAARRRNRLVRFMAKQAVFENPLAGPVMRAMRHIPVDREQGAAAYRRAVRLLAAGEAVGVFPEATISRAFVLKSFKLGAATLAVKEQAPLVPVVIWGSQRTFTVDRHYSVRRGKTISIYLGEPLRPAPSEDPVAVDAELRRRMDALLAQAWQDYPERPRDEADRWWVPCYWGGTAPNLEVAAERERAAKARRALRKARSAGPTRPTRLPR